MSDELEFAPSTNHIKLDLFPATVHLGPIDGEDNEIIHRESRVIVTNDYIYVILVGMDGVYFALKEELVEFEMHPRIGYRVVGANNDYVVVRDGNCGCGTRLRGMRFLPGVGHVAMRVAQT